MSQLASWVPNTAIVLIIVVVVTAVHAIVQRTARKRTRAPQNDVAGFIFSVVGVLYAVVLGFVVIVAWEKFDQAQTYVDEEVAQAADLYHVVVAMPPTLRDHVAPLVRAYVHENAAADWQHMAPSVYENDGLSLLEQISSGVYHFVPHNAAENNLHDRAIQYTAGLLDARRHRITEMDAAVPGVLWFALLAGGIATVGCAFLFEMENRSAQLLMTALLAGLIGVLFVVIWEFDYPFSGAVAVAPEGWQRLDGRLDTIR